MVDEAPDEESQELEDQNLEEKKQTQELKKILHKIDTDGAPQLISKEPVRDIEKEEIVINKLQLQDSPLRGKESVPKAEKPTGKFGKDLTIFFTQLGRAYEKRYSLWESTFVSIMKILKKMRKYNAVQTEKLISTIQDLDEKLQEGLNAFSIKRDEMERYSGIDYKLISKNFKRTLELLQLQLLEIQMREEINQLYQIYAK